MTRIYDYFKSKPSEQVVRLDKAPGLPAGTFIGMNRTKNMWMIKGAEKWRPFSEVYCPFSAGSVNNLNDKTNYPLTNNKTSPTWWYSIAFPNGDIVLVDKFERLAEVQQTVPTAVFGGVQKVVQGVNSILGAVCSFDSSGNVNGFLKTGKLSDGTDIPDVLPRGYKPLPHKKNWCRFSASPVNLPVVNYQDNTLDKVAVVDDETLPSGGVKYSNHFGSNPGYPRFEIGNIIGESRFNQAFAVSCYIKVDQSYIDSLNTGYSIAVEGIQTSRLSNISGFCSDSSAQISSYSRGVTVKPNVTNVVKIVMTFEVNDTDQSPVNIYVRATPGIRTGEPGTLTVSSPQFVFGEEIDTPVPTAGSSVERQADIPQLPANILPAGCNVATIAVRCGVKSLSDDYLLSRKGFYIRHHAVNNKIYIYDNNGLSSDVLSTASAYTVDNIETVIAVFDRDRIFLYINGVKPPLSTSGVTINDDLSCLRDLGANDIGGGDLQVGHSNAARQVELLKGLVIKPYFAMSDTEVRALHNFLMEQ